jgi:predicted RNase H-like HicB family nuclease
MSVAKYHIDIFWSDEDDCWVANVPDLKYCSAFGDSPAEAAREIEIAMGLWLEVQEETARPIPEPTYISRVSHPSTRFEEPTRTR